MKHYFQVFTLTCFSAIISLFGYSYLSGTTPTVRYHEDIKISVAYDLFKLCDKICDRSMKNCFDTPLTILVYQNASLDRMTFRQVFSPYVRNRSIAEVLKEHLDKKLERRTYCPVTDIDSVYGTLEKQGRCAIVGNGGILLKSGCGREIDSNNFVIRANFAGLENYSDDVGKKTSLMMINDATLTNMYNTLVAQKGGKDKFDTMMRYIKLHLNDTVIWFAKSTESHRSAARLKKIAELFAKYELRPKLAYSVQQISSAAARRWKLRSYPSSGVDILAAAEAICKNMTLYGFYPYDKDPQGNEVLHHYYEPNLTDFHTKSHNFDKEHKMLRSLHAKGFLRLAIDPCKPYNTTTAAPLRSTN